MQPADTGKGKERSFSGTEDLSPLMQWFPLRPVRFEETRPPPAQAVPHGSRGKKSEFLLRAFRAQGVPRNLETPCSFLHWLNRGNFSNDKQSIGIMENISIRGLQSSESERSVKPNRLSVSHGCKNNFSLIKSLGRKTMQKSDCSLALRGIISATQDFIIVMQIASVPSGEKSPVSFGDGIFFRSLQYFPDRYKFIRHGPFPVRNQA